MSDLDQLALLLRQRRIIDDQISELIGRPAQLGHAGEYIASKIFDIRLHDSAVFKGSDGFFTTGLLAGKSVNVKWYPKLEYLIDINVDGACDFYLVFTSPPNPPISSRGTTRPWVIDSVFLFDLPQLIANLRLRGVKIGIATSTTKAIWTGAEIYPMQRSPLLVLTATQRRQLALFASV